VALRYLTIDFNSFFASVEQQERPELRGKPVAIVPVLAETTGCVAVSLEAKAAGLTRNIRVSDARRLCPGLIVVEARPETYITYHRKLKDIVESCLPVWKTQSIDEVTCKLTPRFATRASAEAIAKKIKATIARDAGPLLRSSIGIAPTWLLAKVASDMQKPDGLVILDEADIPGKLLHLKIEDISGIGRNMGERLRQHGIDTVEKLYAAKMAEFRGLWRGVVGERMWRLLHCEDLPFPEEDSSQIGHGHVLPPKKRNHPEALAVLHRLLQKAAMRLRHAGRYAGGLRVSVDYADDTHWSGEMRLTETQDTLVFTHALNELWRKRPEKFSGRTPLRIGVLLVNLIDLRMHTPDLFGQQAEQTHDKLFQAVDHLNKVLGKNTVYFGGAHGATQDAPMRIAFTRIPEPEIEEIDRSYQGRLKKTGKPADPQDESAPAAP
jgi:DNA polymerase-4